MCLYMDQLKSPERGQMWGGAMALLIIAWLVFHPLCIWLMTVTLGAKRFEKTLKKVAIKLESVRVMLYGG